MSGYVIKLRYDDGTDLSGSDLEKALEDYVKSIDSVMVGDCSYSVASSSFSFGNDMFMPYTYDSTYGSQKDSILLSFSGFDMDGDTSVTISAGDSYPEIELIIDEGGKLKTSKATENSVSEEVKTSDENKVTEGEKGTVEDVITSEGNTQTEDDKVDSEGAEQTEDDKDASEDTAQTEDDKADSEDAAQTEEDKSDSEGTEQTEDDAEESEEGQKDASGETADDDEQMKETSDVEE